MDEQREGRWGRVGRLGRFARPARDLVSDILKLDLVLFANAMAFSGFLSIVPLIALSGWVSQTLASDAAPIFSGLQGLLPSSVADLAIEEGTRLGRGAMFLAPLGIVGFLWLASGGVATAMRALERIHDAEPRSLVRRRLLALGFVVVAMPLLTLGSAAAAFAGPLGLPSPLDVLPLGVALWLLAWGFLAIATRRTGQRRLRGSIAGSLLTFGCWVASSVSFTNYVGRFSRYPTFYGGLAAIIVLMVWLWLVAFSLLLGGYLQARLERPRRPPERDR